MANFNLISAVTRWIKPDGTPTRDFYLFINSLFTASGSGGGFGTAANQNIGTSGSNVPLLNASNTWDGTQTFDNNVLRIKGSVSGQVTLDAQSAASGTMTLPNGNDTVMGLAAAQSPTNKTIASGSNTLDVIQVKGTTTNDSANAGNLGEFISSTIASGSAVSLSNGVSANITSISLTAGDWDVFGNVVTAPAAGTTTSDVIAAASTSSTALPTAPAGGYVNFPFAAGATAVVAVPLGQSRLSLAATTTVYLVANVSFAVSTLAAYGFLGARRRR